MAVVLRRRLHGPGRKGHEASRWCWTEIIRFQKPARSNWRSAFSGSACRILPGQRNSLMARCFVSEQATYVIDTRKTPKATAKWQGQWNRLSGYNGQHNAQRCFPRNKIPRILLSRSGVSTLNVINCYFATMTQRYGLAMVNHDPTNERQQQRLHQFQSEVDKRETVRKATPCTVVHASLNEHPATKRTIRTQSNPCPNTHQKGPSC